MNIKEAVKIAVSIIILRLITVKIVKIYEKTNRNTYQQNSYLRISL